MINTGNLVLNGSFEVDTANWIDVGGSQPLTNPLAASQSILTAVDGQRIGTIYHGSGAANSAYYTDVPVKIGTHIFTGSYAQTGPSNADEGFTLSVVSGSGTVDVAPVTGQVGQAWVRRTGRVTMSSSGTIRITARHDSTGIGSFWMDAISLTTKFFPDGDELYDDLLPLVDTWGDPNEDLRTFVNGLGLMIEPVDNVAKDGLNGEPGWSQILDLTRVDNDGLAWLGQWAGYLVPKRASSEAQAVWSARERQRIVTRAANRRAGISILREVIQEHLSGAKNVIIQERVGDAHTINVYVYNTEIATSAVLAEAAARSQKAYGLIMNFTVLTGANYSLLQASNASYTVLLGKHANYNSVLTNPGL